MTDPQVLISRYFAGTFSSQEIAELRPWILSDPANALEYARASFVHNALYQTLSGDGRLQDLQDLEHLALDETMVGVRFEDSWAVSEQPSLPFGPEASACYGEGEAVEQAGAPKSFESGPRRFSWRTAAAIFVPLVLALGAWGLFHFKPASAILVASVDTQWASTLAEPALGAGLPAKLLDLKTGLAKVRFASGAETIVQGPARFRVRSDNGIDLDIGRPDGRRSRSSTWLYRSHPIGRGGRSGNRIWGGGFRGSFDSHRGLPGESRGASERARRMVRAGRWWGQGRPPM